MSAHTPGPWRAVLEEQTVHDSKTGTPHVFQTLWIRSADQTVAVACSHSEATQANAALIAAAPELLEALKMVLAVADRKTKEFDFARAAIAKAEGRETGELGALKE